MIARNETIFKWALYAAATALCMLVQTGLLQRLAFWGVLPFLYPLLAAIPATFRAPWRGASSPSAWGWSATCSCRGPSPACTPWPFL